MSKGKTGTGAELPYRRGVGAMLFNAGGKVWVGRRAGPRYRNAWQMPQGAIDEGERPEQALFRELEEEIGTRNAEIVAEARDWLTYDLPPELIGVTWKGKYRGQTQKWFALRFTGVDSDIDLDAHKKPEFSAWQWVDMAHLPDLIVPFKRRLYEDVVAEFRAVQKRIATDG